MEPIYPYNKASRANSMIEKIRFLLWMLQMLNFIDICFMVFYRQCSFLNCLYLCRFISFLCLCYKSQQNAKLKFNLSCVLLAVAVT